MEKEPALTDVVQDLKQQVEELTGIVNILTQILLSGLEEEEIDPISLDENLNDIDVEAFQIPDSFNN